MKSNKVMNRDDLCEYFGVCKGTITRWIKNEDFPQAARQGRSRTWKFSQIENWVHSKQTNPPENAKFRNQIERIKLSPNYQPPQQGLEKLKKIAQKSKKAPQTPKQELLTINPAFEEKVLQGVIENITAAVLPKIEQNLAQTTNQIINKVATNLLHNFGR